MGPDRLGVPAQLLGSPPMAQEVVGATGEAVQVMLVAEAQAEQAAPLKIVRLEVLVVPLAVLMASEVLTVQGVVEVLAPMELEEMEARAALELTGMRHTAVAVAVAVGVALIVLLLEEPLGMQVYTAVAVAVAGFH